jgi:protoheme IX farnesyltransferase
MSVMAYKSATLSPPRPALARARDYWALTKPEVNFLVVAAVLAGFYLASAPGGLGGWLLFHTLVGTLLVASGTATLNQYLERDADALMRRTARRPLPSRRVVPSEALAFGMLLTVTGGIYLWLAANPLASVLALLTFATYLLFYTPLKRRTAWCTFVGAFPGAMPPLIGWAGARGTLDAEAWILYAMLFLWQFPHFLAIAWMYREDYQRAGMRMLPADGAGRAMAWQVLLTSATLVPVSLLPVAAGQSGWAYFIGALMLGLAFLHAGARLAAGKSTALARRLLMASIIYLPLVFALMMLDRAA